MSWPGVTTMAAATSFPRWLRLKNNKTPNFNMGVPSHQTTWKSLTFL